MIENPNSLRYKILRMRPMQTLAVGFAENGGRSCRYYASILGTEYGRRYSVTVDKANGNYIITRHE